MGIAEQGNDAEDSGPKEPSTKSKIEELTEFLEVIISAATGKSIDEIYAELDGTIVDPIKETRGFIRMIESSMGRPAEIEWVTLWVNNAAKVVVMSEKGQGCPPIRVIEEIFETVAHSRRTPGALALHEVDEHEDVKIYQLEMDHEWFESLAAEDRIDFIKMLKPAIG